MNKDFKYIPKDKRKKIMLIADDIRVHSGVATVAKEIVLKTCQHFNWVNVAGAIKHPEKGKRLDLSKDTADLSGVEDASVMMYPVDGYGDPRIIREILNIERPNAILLITDPRYFMHIWNMEQEIRKQIPIAYLNIWDDYPAPMYNRPYYEACDLLMGISKQTVNINKLVLEGKEKNKIFKYVPHGLDHNIYKPIDKDDPDFIEWKNNTFGKEKYDFILFFNSRNIRRKQIPDTMLAFRAFLDSLPKEKAKKCLLMMHTEYITDAGTHLGKVKEYLFDENYFHNVKFSLNKVDNKQLNYLYNAADCQVLITCNEGWGLTLTEAMLSGTPIIANTTGGMQDQMRFIDNDGKWFEPDANVPSNHRGTYKKHGEWAFPVYPTSRSIQGSPPTPYIFDDRCAWEDVTERIKEVYELGPEERERRGLAGREWALSNEAGFTAEQQGKRVIEAFDELFKTWKPREKYEIVNATKYKGKFLNHKIVY
jgi:glycosyltransferase involved in cell wall biosynthesis